MWVQGIKSKEGIQAWQQEVSQTQVNFLIGLNLGESFILNVGGTFWWYSR